MTIPETTHQNPSNQEGQNLNRISTPDTEERLSNLETQWKEFFEEFSELLKKIENKRLRSAARKKQLQKIRKALTEILGVLIKSLSVIAGGIGKLAQYTFGIIPLALEIAIFSVITPIVMLLAGMAVMTQKLAQLSDNLALTERAQTLITGLKELFKAEKSVIGKTTELFFGTTPKQHTQTTWFFETTSRQHTQNVTDTTSITDSVNDVQAEDTNQSHAVQAQSKPKKRKIAIKLMQEGKNKIIPSRISKYDLLVPTTDRMKTEYSNNLSISPCTLLAYNKAQNSNNLTQRNNEQLITLRL